VGSANRDQTERTDGSPPSALSGISPARGEISKPHDPGRHLCNSRTGSDKSPDRFSPLPRLITTPHQNPAREPKLAGGLGHVLVRENNPDLWGTGERPVVVERGGLGAFHPRPTGERSPAPSGHGPASFPRKITSNPGRFRIVRPRYRPNPPFPDVANAKMPAWCDQDVSGRRLEW